eukprot:IDg6704t1
MTRAMLRRWRPAKTSGCEVFVHYFLITLYHNGAVTSSSPTEHYPRLPLGGQRFLTYPNSAFKQLRTRCKTQLCAADMGPLRRNTVTRHLSFSGATPRAPLASVENIAKRPRLSKSAIKKRPVIRAKTTNSNPLVAAVENELYAVPEVLAGSDVLVESNLLTESNALAESDLLSSADLLAGSDVLELEALKDDSDPTPSVASVKPTIPCQPIVHTEPSEPSEPTANPIAVLLRVRPLSVSER